MRWERPVSWLFACTSFLTAALVFMVEPMVAKLVLPAYGGSTGVWNVVVMFFQLALLSAYAFAYGSWKLLGRRQPWVHVAAVSLPLFTLPLTLPRWTAPSEEANASLWLALVLMVMVGATFVALATTSPILQAWLSSTAHSRASNPYFLYATSNVGSLVGLLSYPFLIEPELTLSQQTRWWSIGYALASILLIVCALTTVRLGRGVVSGVTSTSTDAAAERLTWRRRGWWVLLAALPSSLMLGVTTQVTTDIGSLPLIWVLPLALYLATFIVAFSAPSAPWQRHVGPVAVVLVALAFAVVSIRAGSSQLMNGIVLFGVFTAVALASHRRLAADRPSSAHVTQYFLLVSVGGAIGGVFNALIAPLVFEQAVEYLLVLAVAVVVLSAKSGDTFRDLPKSQYVLAAGCAVVVSGSAATRDFVWVGVGLLSVLTALFLAAKVWPRWTNTVVSGTLALVVLYGIGDGSIRSFYGVYRVEREGDQISLYHGTTLHGSQHVDPVLAVEPTTYYTSAGPFGDAMRAARNAGPLHAWAAIGLGTGSALTYTEDGEEVDVYEIDPLGVEIATTRGPFTYVENSKGRVRLFTGDGRLQIGKAADGRFDMVVVDAFSSDSIPTHLLTNEAIGLYRQKMTPDGLLVMHISNRNIDLEPVLAGAAREQGLHGLIGSSKEKGGRNNASPSVWVVLSADSARIDPLRVSPRWHPLTEKGVLWTDDYSNIVRLLR